MRSPPRICACDTLAVFGDHSKARCHHDIGLSSCVPSMFDSLRGESPRSSLMEVKESEAQGRRREAGSEGSVERTREPMDKNRMRGRFGRTSWHESAKSTSIKDQSGKFGGCAWKIVKLTSGGLCRLGPRLAYERRVRRSQGFLIAAQKSAEGVVAASVERARHSSGRRETASARLEP